ncbi:MAG: hypothetical protein JSS74_09945 [Actinobacteria bacterium]|nr:hypothetical protein [Actinomycetota bacterium]
MATPYMPYSTPVGKHPIDHLDGTPSDILARGTQITDLGAEMTKAWKLIERLVADGAEMEGEAIDKLRKVAEEVNGDLGKGGELYTAVGPHITDYGKAVELSQPRLNQLAEDLRTKWNEYFQAESTSESKQCAVGNEPGADAEQDDKDKYDKAKAASAAAAGHASDVHGQWTALAHDYDLEWNTWHTAYEHAVSSIKGGMSGKIEDSWKDDLKGFLNELADVLTVLGIVLAVLAIIVGGPIVMALGAIVAVLTLAVQITKYAIGDGDPLGLAFAIIGCVPFIGPGFKFFKGLGGAGVKGFFKGFAGEFGRDFLRLGSREVLALKGAGPGSKALDFTTGMLTGKHLPEWASLGSRGIDALDTVSSVWSAQLGIVNTIFSGANGTFPRAFDAVYDWATRG